MSLCYIVLHWISYHIMPYYLILYHINIIYYIISDQIISYCIILHHTISEDVIVYHNMSQYTILYRTVSCCTVDLLEYISHDIIHHIYIYCKYIYICIPFCYMIVPLITSGRFTIAYSRQYITGTCQKWLLESSLEVSWSLGSHV